MWACTSCSLTWSINSLQIQAYGLSCVTPLSWWSQSEWLKNQYSNRHPLYLIRFIKIVVWTKQLLYSAGYYRNINLTVSDEQGVTLKWDVDSVNNPKAVHYWSGCRAKWLKKLLWHHSTISKYNAFFWVCTFHHASKCSNTGTCMRANKCTHVQTEESHFIMWAISWKSTGNMMIDYFSSCIGLEDLVIIE